MTGGPPDIFKGLAESEVKELMTLGKEVGLLSGAELFPLGGEADRLYLIRRGSIKLTMPIRVHGQNQDIFLDERKAGQTVGWSALTPPFHFTLRAVAAQDAEVLAFPREELRRYLSSHPSIGYAVSQNLATVIGQRLQLFQTMWVREMQRMVERHCA